ncbi:MAG: hemerythrin domain-containing protein [Candidatus Binataceae bacterium]
MASAKSKSKSKTASRPQMDAIAMLKEDHRKVDDLFEQYERSRGKKAQIAQQICMELTIHALLEEEIFYPACREAGVEEDDLDEAAVEHDGAKVLIAELREGSPDDEYYDAKVSVLAEEIRHHVDEEEERGGVFSQMKSAGADLKALGEQMAARKEELKAEIEARGLPAPITRTMKAKQLDRAPARE